MAANKQIINLAYDDGNRESSRTHGNGLVSNKTYVTNENLLDTITVVGYPQLSMDYTYDDNKNVTTETFDATGSMDDYSFTAGYDDEDRLIDWDRSNGDTQDWTLTKVGDWSSFNENGTAVSRTHNDVHELTAIGANSLTYDVKGNLLTDTDNHTYTWDFDNHLKSAAITSSSTRGTEGTHTYEYDALGRRVAKQVSDESGMTTVVTKTTYINNYSLLPPLSSVGGQVLAEYEKTDTGNTTLARTYVYGEYIDEPLSITDHSSTPVTYYYHQNRVFNVVGLTDDNDTVIELYTYTPYGTVDIRDPSNMAVRTTSDYGNTYTFTGRRTDAETSLHYFRARYMDPVLGRFIGRDPIGFDGSQWNLYEYAESSPTTKKDPTGLHSLADCDRWYDQDCNRCRAMPNRTWGDGNRRRICWAGAFAEYSACIASSTETLVMAAGCVIVTIVVLEPTPFGEMILIGSGGILLH